MSPFLPYNLALAPLVPAIGIYTLYRRHLQNKSPQSLAGQWGAISPEMRAFGAFDGPKFWIHAVSVGELMTARAFFGALKSEFPGCQIALSTTTDAGFELAATFLERQEIALVFGFPLDLPFVINRVLNALRPDVLALVETELWPNTLHLARQRGVQTVLLNGRVSDNLLKTAPRLGPLWKWMLENLSLALMRGESDAARLQSLGASENQVLITGDAKLEAPAVEWARPRELWRQRLGLQKEKLLIAGSTHEGEEAIILALYQALLREHPTWKLAIAPRHLQRCGEVAKLAENAGFFVQRRTTNQKMGAQTVFLLDSVGELADFYAAADLSLVGGSWIPRGGHNMIEPILRGSPVLWGPHVANFRAAAQFATQNQLGACVQAPDLFMETQKWIETQRGDFWPRATEALKPHQGATQRAVRAIKEHLALQ